MFIANGFCRTMLWFATHLRTEGTGGTEFLYEQALWWRSTDSEEPGKGGGGGGVKILLPFTATRGKPSWQ